MKQDRVSLRHRPFLTPIWLTICAAAAVFVLTACALWLFGTAEPTTIVLVGEPAEDAAQAQEAPALLKMFGDAKAGRLDAIYALAGAGYRAIGAPLAARLAIGVESFSGDDPTRFARRALGRHRGGRIMIISSAGALPGILASLTGARPGSNDDPGAHLLYVVSVPRIGRANFIRVGY